MSQAIANPEELRRFAMSLKKFNNDLLSQMTVVHGQLSGLSSSWRDREHDKFVEEFEQTMQVIGRFIEATNEHVPFLLRKAQRVEDYLQQRVGGDHEPSQCPLGRRAEGFQERAHRLRRGGPQRPQRGRHGRPPDSRLAGT